MLELVLQIIRKRNRGEHNFQANSSCGSPNWMDILLKRLVKSVTRGSRNTLNFQKHKFYLRAASIYLNVKQI